MDHIDNLFTNACLPRSTNDPAIRAAIEVAKKTLNRYYTLTDLSELYRIAMGEFGSTSEVLLSMLTYQILCSTSPSSQTGILQGSWMGSGLDQHCPRHGPRTV